MCGYKGGNEYNNDIKKYKNEDQRCRIYKSMNLLNKIYIMKLNKSMKIVRKIRIKL